MASTHLVANPQAGQLSLFSSSCSQEFPHCMQVLPERLSESVQARHLNRQFTDEAAARQTEASTGNVVVANPCEAHKDPDQVLRLGYNDGAHPSARESADAGTSSHLDDFEKARVKHARFMASLHLYLTCLCMRY